MADARSPVAVRPVTITYLGHATVLIEQRSVRILTDPLLRRRVAHLRRMTPLPDRAAVADIDAVLISHVHGDHLDPRSLREVGARRVIVPAGVEHWRGLRGIAGLEPIARGRRVSVAAVEVAALRSDHDRRRRPGPSPAADPLGYVIAGDARVYFAGDTDLFEEMATIGRLDVALVPIAGWGPRVGAGHLDPHRAAAALRLLRPRVAVPIHWGTYLAATVRRRRHALRDPPREFAAAAAEVAPEVEVAVLEPGATLRLP